MRSFLACSLLLVGCATRSVEAGPPVADPVVEPVDDVTAPAARDWRDAVVYGVVPFFFDGQGFDGVTDRVDEIAALGATVLWLSPVAAAPDDDFGYAITDHRALRETFGADEDLRELVAAAHDHGLAVVVDLAINHTSDQHPWYQAAIADPASPYADYYDRDANGEVTFYFDWENLPNLSYDHPVVREEMLDALQWWVDTYDIDGFRLDAAWGVQRRADDFLPEARRRLGPDVLLIAEASAREDVWATQGVDAAYDWTDALGVWAWREAFEQPDRTATLLREAIAREGSVPVLRFVDNNDTGERFAIRYGDDVARAAAALLATLPGIPLVYTGTEVGADLDVYQEGPPLDWSDPLDLTGTWTDWLALRRAHPALRGDALRFVDAEEPVLAYWREGEGERLLVAIGFGDGEVPAQSLDLVDLRDGSRWPAGAPIPVPAYGARVLTPG